MYSICYFTNLFAVLFHSNLFCLRLQLILILLFYLKQLLQKVINCILQIRLESFYWCVNGAQPKRARNQPSKTADNVIKENRTNKTDSITTQNKIHTNSLLFLHFKALSMVILAKSPLQTKATRVSCFQIKTQIKTFWVCQWNIKSESP